MVTITCVYISHNDINQDTSIINTMINSNYVTDTQALPYSGSPGGNCYCELHLSPHKINRSETNGINDTSIISVTNQICAELKD